MKHSNVALKLALGIYHANNGTEVAGEANTGGTNAAVLNQAVEGEQGEVAVATDPNTFKHSFYFRSMPDNARNREALEALGEIEESVDETDPEKPRNMIRRKTETYTFVLPVVNTTDPKLDVVMRELIKEQIVAHAKPYVTEGKVPPPEKLTWEAIVEARYIAITTASVDEAASGFNSSLLKEVAEKFSNYMKAVGRDVKGTEIMAKMITGRFSVITTHKYINGLDMVKGNIENWILEGCSEEEQAIYGDVVDYLLKKLEEAKNPVVVETGSLFG
jgi:hypothetical protein